MLDLCVNGHKLDSYSRVGTLNDMQLKSVTDICYKYHLFYFPFLENFLSQSKIYFVDTN